MCFFNISFLYQGHVEVTRLLLSNGASVNEKCNDDKTAIIASALGGRNEHSNV
jgi:hypothetical protein